MEFRMTTDLSTALKPQEIAFNYDELKTQLAEKLEKYKGLLVTEDGIAEAKKDRALLRKVRDALNAEKITVKKQWMEPYTEFEQKVKVLLEMCDAPAREIDEQIKAFEERKKREKRDTLEAVFREKIGDAGEYVSFEDIFDPKWLNATCALETATEQVEEICSRYVEDTLALDELCETVDSSMAVSLKARYRSTKSIACVLQAKKDIEREIAAREERRKAEEARRMEAERRAQESIQDAVSAEQPKKNPAEAPKETPKPVEQYDGETKTVIRFQVKGTMEQLRALQKFMQENGIEYGAI
mgnify:FL=1